jgi:hypothetical protein
MVGAHDGFFAAKERKGHKGKLFCPYIFALFALFCGYNTGVNTPER